MNQDIMEKARALSLWANGTVNQENTIIAIMSILFPDATLLERQKLLEAFRNKPETSLSQYELMEKRLLSVRRAYENQAFKSLLAIRIQIVADLNKTLSPFIDRTHWCETCGSHSGKCHPTTGYCFKCDTDNWEPENWRHSI